MLTVIILTFNEEIHIKRVIENVVYWADEVIVLDSGSTDLTCEVVKRYDVKLFDRKFDNYSSQRNYAIRELPISNKWILFLDADEYLSEELKGEISQAINNVDANGFYLKRKFLFLDKVMNYGNLRYTYLLRLFKKGKCEYTRDINEYPIVKGKVKYLNGLFFDNNLNNMKYWFLKHLNYAQMEAIDLYSFKNQLNSHVIQGKHSYKDYIRYKLFYKIPSLIRPLFYFIYIFIFRLGFLNGMTGLIYHISHDLIYRYIIEIFYLELKWSKK